jgi:hypothetical protein
MTRPALALLLLAAGCATAGPGGGARDPGPGAPPPPVAYGDEILRLAADMHGFQRPELADPGCLGSALRRAKGAAGVDNKVKFAVLRDGSLARFSYLKPVTEEQARSIEAAFETCRWNPGLDPTGQAVAVWVIQPIKVGAAP